MKLFKARASRCGDAMTGSKDKSDPLGATCRTYLEAAYIAARWGRHKDFTNKYIDKGLGVDVDLITVYSRYMKMYFTKNQDDFEDDYFTGHPDLFRMDGARVDEVIDIKSSWDLHTFYKSRKDLNQKYWWQLQVYMHLVGARKARLVYCLIDTPQKLIDQAVRYAVNDGAAMSEELIEVVRKNMTFNDMPIRNRVVEYQFEFEPKCIVDARAKIDLMRKAFVEMWEFDDDEIPGLRRSVGMLE